MISEKEEAKRLIEAVTWNDIMYEFYVKKKLADSLRAANEGRVLSHEEVKDRLARE